jgi:hypothetical protein
MWDSSDDRTSRKIISPVWIFHRHDMDMDNVFERLIERLADYLETGRVPEDDDMFCEFTRLLERARVPHRELRVHAPKLAELVAGADEHLLRTRKPVVRVGPSLTAANQAVNALQAIADGAELHQRRVLATMLAPAARRWMDVIDQLRVICCANDLDICDVMARALGALCGD